MAKIISRKRSSDLASRVQGLVDRYHGGSVNAAAAAIGVPQRSLARVAAGEVTSPRVAILEAIARYFGVSLDWLTSGVGETPPVASPIGEAGSAWLQWRRLVVDLALPAVSREALWHLPLAATWAWRDLCAGKQEDGKRSTELLAQVNEAETSLWLMLFRGLIESYGLERVRQALIDHPDWIRLGFNRLAMDLRAQGKIRGDLAAPFERSNEGAWAQRAPQRGDHLG